jgi:integrase
VILAESLFAFERYEKKWMGRDSNSRPPACKADQNNQTLVLQKQEYDRKAFFEYLTTVKEHLPKTANGYVSTVGTFMKLQKTPEQFANSYEKINCYNNAVKSLIHFSDFLGVTRPNLKCKQQNQDKLIISPKSEQVKEIIKKLEPLDLKSYIALCASVGLRPQRLHALKWSEIDFENGIVNVNENIKTKHYRPNPLHSDVAKLLLEYKKQTKGERIFTFCYKRLTESLKAIGTPLRPNNMRDHFFNEARKAGVDRDLIEWLMGHSIGIKAHYLADEIKTEYAKFETAFRLTV